MAIFLKNYPIFAASIFSKSAFLSYSCIYSVCLLIVLSIYKKARILTKINKFTIVHLFGIVWHHFDNIILLKKKDCKEGCGKLINIHVMIKSIGYFTYNFLVFIFLFFFN